MSAAPPELLNHPQYAGVTELARGGMGVVFKATNVLMDRPEVLKVLTRDAAATAEAGDRFLREIRAAAKLQHPNVVTAYAALQLGDVLVFAMEYVPGDDLGKLVAAGGPLAPAQACYYAYQAALGLEHAHERGMVHRDIKPSNLIVHRDGRRRTLKILDFGLAKANRETAAATGLTGTGQLLGTPDYMAPEQSADAGAADIRADIYSLGCTLYFLLAGHPPFRGKNLYDLLTAHQSRVAPPLHEVRPDVPAELSGAVARMMAKDPADRFQTPLAAATALKPFVTVAAGTGDTAATPVETILTAEVVDAAAKKPKHWEPPSVFRNAPVPQDTKHLNPEDFAPPVRGPAKKTKRSKKKPKPAGVPKSLWFGAGGAAVLGGAGLVLFAFEKPLPKADPVPPPTPALRAVPVEPRTVAGPPVPETADRFEPLFNGRDLTGWKVQPGRPGNWAVVNGILTGSNDPSFLFSDRGDLRDVHVRAEVRVSADGNAGLLVRAPFGPAILGGKGQKGYYGQIDHRTPNVPKTGSLLADAVIAAELTEPAARAGEWYTMELIALGPGVRVLVNGRETAALTDPLPRAHGGHVALELGTEGTVIEFRRVDVRRLPAPPAGPAFTVPAGRETAAAARFDAVESYPFALLKGWADKLPEGERPVWIAKRTGTDEVLFDAVAAPVAGAAAWDLRANDSWADVAADAAVMTARGYRSDLTAPHRTGAVRLWVKDDRPGTTGDGEWKDVLDPLRAGYKTARLHAFAGAVRGDGTPIFTFAFLGSEPGPRRETRINQPLERLVAFTADYRKRNRRPVIVSAIVDGVGPLYVSHFEENVAGVVWDFSPWLSLADYAAAKAAYRKAGLRPRCVSSAIRDDKLGFTVVWTDEK